MRKRWKSAYVVALDLALPMLCRIRPGWVRPVVRVNGDARALPLADASVDVLFSNLCLQWIDDVPALFHKVRQVVL
jgi:malonyl-CoA O-methyltransferase